jgi:hypothetical protein
MKNGNIYNSNPKDINFSNNITKDSFTIGILDNTFIIFESFDQLLYLIYSKRKSIISYDLINNKKINEIRNAHKEDISNFRHFSDKLNKRILVISISKNDNNIKLWCIINLKLLANITKVNQDGFLYSACFLRDKNQNYIITSNWSFSNPETIKVFDLNGKKVKEINSSNDKTFYVDNFYDKKLGKNFIITSSNCYIKSYDFSKNKIYQKYNDKGSEFFGHTSLVIYHDEKLTKLIESSSDGFLRIWNFDTGKLLNRINMNQKIYGVCLWNNNYLFLGCENHAMELIDINKGKSVKKILTSVKAKGEKTIKKVIHPIFGECLISQSQNEQINFWIDKKLCI